MDDKEATRKIGKAIVVCTHPDVCKSPTAPVPYSIVSYFSASSATTSTVRMTSVESFTMASQIDGVVGDEAGAGLGVVSGTHAAVGISKPVGSSSTVNAEKNLVVRHDDPFEMNSGNTRGKVVYVAVGGDRAAVNGQPAQDPNPPVQPETPVEKAWYERAWDSTKAGAEQVGGFGRGAWDAGKETVEGLGSMGKGAWNLTGGWAVDPAASAATWEGLKTTSSTVWNNPGTVWDAVKEPYAREWAAGNYGAALGRGTFEAVGLVVGPKGLDKLAKGSKLGGLAGKADDVARIGDKAADLGATGDKVSDLAKTGDKASDLAKTGDKASDLTKTGDKVEDVADGGAPKGKDNDGVRVTRRLTRKEAEDWWRKNHKTKDKTTGEYRDMTDAELADQMKGVDWNQPVELTELPEGMTMEQWQRVDGSPGAWGANPGSTMEDLAINGNRVPVQYNIDSPIEVLSSRAAPFDAVGAPAGVGGRGGGIQYMLPDNWQGYATRR